MDCRVRLVLAIHNHQPVGNFDGVFEEAYRDSYAPFLEMLAEFPQLSIALHTSGSLMEWLVQAHPEYIDRLRSLVERGQVEILGGPCYVKIIACLATRDPGLLSFPRTDVRDDGSWHVGPRTRLGAIIRR